MITDILRINENNKRFYDTETDKEIVQVKDDHGHKWNISPYCPKCGDSKITFEIVDIIFAVIECPVCNFNYSIKPSNL
jgi:rubredoxin